MVDNLGVREDSKVLGVNRSSDYISTNKPPRSISKLSNLRQNVLVIGMENSDTAKSSIVTD